MTRHLLDVATGHKDILEEVREMHIMDFGRFMQDIISSEFTAINVLNIIRECPTDSVECKSKVPGVILWYDRKLIDEAITRMGAKSGRDPLHEDFQALLVETCYSMCHNTIANHAKIGRLTAQMRQSWLSAISEKVPWLSDVTGLVAFSVAFYQMAVYIPVVGGSVAAVIAAITAIRSRLSTRRWYCDKCQMYHTKACINA